MLAQINTDQSVTTACVQQTVGQSRLGANAGTQRVPPSIVSINPIGVGGDSSLPRPMLNCVSSGGSI